MSKDLEGTVQDRYIPMEHNMNYSKMWRVTVKSKHATTYHTVNVDPMKFLEYLSKFSGVIDRIIWREL